MSFDHWLAFAAASAIVVAIPGPTVLLVVSYALGHGRRSALALAAGVVLGDLTAMTASMAGMGAVLAASATVFTGLRWLGAAYLIYLGIKLWRAPVATGDDDAPPAASGWRMLAHAYVVTALNPKSIIFFVAFMPQFLVASRPFLPQVALLEATFVTAAMVNVTTYVYLASSARRKMRNPRVQRAVNRTGGTLLIGAGVMAAAWRKAAA